ncbi:MAG: hypothetical protein JJ884_07020 [Maricaulis sp.]|uniref:primase-helicase family protein n=1 Tax=Maricaulis sp. TaxID=1486257 RepID=UPI001B14044C|nr:DUF5906 domain-containing protein [Maricaulis sp.]MBO6847254.1 hypothetical protein [Maricaulis sp.]MBO6876547.1 hypothetical protein [Maricaulis sp.]
MQIQSNPVPNVGGGKRCVTEMDSEYFFELYEPFAGRGYLAVSELDESKPPRTRWFSTADLKSAYDHMLECARNRQVYHSWGVYAGIPASGRGRGSDILGLPGIFIDADVLSPDEGVHAQKKLPETQQLCLEWLKQSQLPTPSAVRSSGNGLYFDWVFKQPLTFETEKERASLHKEVQRFHQVVRELANSDRGWVFDNVSDLARITRAPGTQNHKTCPSKPVTVLTSYDQLRDNKYDLDELMLEVEPLVKKDDAELKETKQLELEEPVDFGGVKRANFVAIEKGCGAVSKWVRNPQEQSYEDWLALLRVLSRCERGEDLAHKISRNDARRYDPSETSKKYEEATKSMSPPTCGYISSELGEAACNDCPMKGTIHSPMSLGYMDPQVAGLHGEFVLDVVTSKCVSMKTGQAYSEKGFNNRFNHLVDKGNVHNELVRSKKAGKVEMIDYQPGVDDRLIKTEAGQVFNSWRDGGVEPVEGDCSTILSHLEKLTNNRAEFDHILRYQAELLQNGASKILHCLLITSNQGVGKSVLIDIWRNMIGSDNVHDVPPDQANTKYRASWANNQILFFEELRVGNKGAEFSNELKPWITQEFIEVEEKHIAVSSARTPRGMFAFSNFRSPLEISKDDRRYYVVHSKMQKREPEYYEKLWIAVHSEAAAFKHFLLNLDTSGFNPKGPPPVTESKLEMLENARPALELELERLIATKRGCFAKDLVTRDQIHDALSISMLGNWQYRELTEAIHAVGLVRRDTQIALSDGSRPRLWIVRNIDSWGSATPQRIREHLGDH